MVTIPGPHRNSQPAAEGITVPDQREWQLTPRAGVEQAFVGLAASSMKTAHSWRLTIKACYGVERWALGGAL
jgi:hypothetical protein